MATFTLRVSAQEIPAGVNYKKASDETNLKAKQLLETALRAKANDVNIGKISDGAIACGPLLWEAIKEKAPIELQKANSMIIVIPAKTPVRKEGRGLSTPEEKRAFWNLFANNVVGTSSFSIRQAVTSEIAYYWATIPFDIEEPLLVIDLGATKILVNFTKKNGEPKIFWMDIVGDLKNLK